MSRLMEGLLFALLADGPSDRALIPILQWTVRHIAPKLQQRTPVFCVRRPPGTSIPDEVQRLVQDYGVNLVFVHRDAEGMSLQQRKAQIPANDLVVPVVPVRMTEAWLLIEEKAIRRAAGNPNGTIKLALPQIGRLDRVVDPKRTLRDLLVLASDLHGRRRASFEKASAVQRVADFIEDFSVLRELEAYRELETDVRSALGKRWDLA